MSLIGNILSPANVILDLDVADKKMAFEQIGLLIEKNTGIAGSDVYNCLFEREKLGSTGLGQGIAIPHGRANGLSAVVGVFIRLKNPIQFDALDGKPVKCLFALLVPKDATDVHLQVLSALAQCFSSRVLREKLLSATSAGEVHQLLTAK